jgi:hypothetical protein
VWRRLYSVLSVPACPLTKSKSSNSRLNILFISKGLRPSWNLNNFTGILSASKSSKLNSAVSWCVACSRSSTGKHSCLAISHLAPVFPDIQNLLQLSFHHTNQGLCKCQVIFFCGLQQCFLLCENLSFLLF